MREARRFPGAAVVSPHYLASAAGAAILDRGGNAVDAAVGANLALGVVAPYLCGYGGDLLAVVWDGRAHGYRSIGRSGRAATRTAVAARVDGPVMPMFGPLTVTVPGAPAGWFALLDRFGSRSFGDLAGAAQRLAEAGFPVTGRAARHFAGCRALYAGDAALLEAYPEGATRAGSVLRQPDLARTIARLARDGPDGYYRGPVADAVAEAVVRAGGLLDPSDLHDHRDAWVDPIARPFAGRDVIQLPPPTQGVSALAMVGIAQRLALGDPGPDRDHLLVEAAKLGLAERDEHLGDPEAMRMGVDELLAASRLDALAAAVDPGRASTPEPRPGPDGGTAYLAAADRDGLAVSLIQTNFSAMGSGVRVPAWGINLQNRGSSFSLDPEHVNVVAPRKLPAHTLIPAAVTRDGRLERVYGTMGGHAQAQVHLQLLVAWFVDGVELQAAVSAPRWAVDPGTWFVGAERRFGAAWVDALERRGHTVRVGASHDDAMGHAHAIRAEPGGWAVATDPRTEGAALGM